MAIMHPMSDRKIKLNHHLVTSRDMDGNPTLGHFSNGLFLYRNQDRAFRRKKKLFEKIDQIEKGVYK